MVSDENTSGRTSSSGTLCGLYKGNGRGTVYGDWLFHQSTYISINAEDSERDMGDIWSCNDGSVDSDFSIGSGSQERGEVGIDRDVKRCGKIFSSWSGINKARENSRWLVKDMLDMSTSN